MQDEWQAHPWLGTVLTASAAVAYSTAGYFTRLIELNIPTVLFWRGLYAGLFMSVCIVLLHGKETVASFATLGCLDCSPRSCPQRRPSAISMPCALQPSRRSWRSMPPPHSSAAPLHGS